MQLRLVSLPLARLFARRTAEINARATDAISRRPACVARLLRVHRSVAVRVGALEGEFDVFEILVLGQRLIVVGIGDLPILFGNAASQLRAIERAIAIFIELVENRAGRRLRLIEVDRAVIVGVDPAERGRRERRREREGQSRRHEQGSPSDELHRQSPRFASVARLFARHSVSRNPP